MADRLEDAVRARSRDARDAERERLRIETANAMTPEERRASASMVARMMAWLAGLWR